MVILQKIKEISTAISKYCNKQRIGELFDESAKVSHNYMMDQISYLDKSNTPEFMKEIYKADVMSRTLEGRALFADYM
ncbi:hypothetical protein J4433_00730 [Candidatus Pacearchaeota archaeon]|nr:hypothetical protein [Candidatus Pacearchaeota archaeon]